VTGVLHQPQAAETCAIGAVLCHSKATCVDHSPGFCCRCSAGFFGDGRNCLPEGMPQRINGKVSGSVNGVAFRDEDLHSYVVTSDGRAYTAVSKVNESVGYDLQTLNAIGAVVGWMFARPSSEALNGYQLTGPTHLHANHLINIIKVESNQLAGGKFNFTSSVEFPQSGHRAVVEQRFLGVDVFNYLRMSVHISGDVPTIPHGSKVEIPDYEEEFIRVGLGKFQASSRRTLRMEGTALDIPFTVEHSVEFDECRYLDTANSTVFKLKVARNFVTYDVKEQIVRYAMTNKISAVDGKMLCLFLPLDVTDDDHFFCVPESDDPCVKGRATCVPHSTCVADRDTFRCVCNQGSVTSAQFDPAELI
jgi:nidogen (entactin)